ncbi:hypothetical protein TRIUR3_21603 [Triticum urartu]|uniref:Uncharacterized protein n=1 Tax=Triticum urartu TaxID=4572 RepID=M7YVE9_TRIUA|nr:hypothetical protein TRIUR3_21603 [Triticum urartu]
MARAAMGQGRMAPVDLASGRHTEEQVHGAVARLWAYGRMGFHSGSACAMGHQLPTRVSSFYSTLESVPRNASGKL